MFVRLEDYDNDYFVKHEVYYIEQLVEKSVYMVFPKKGVKEVKIRKVMYTIGKKTWFVELESTVIPISEIGKTIFFDPVEAEKYQFELMEQYSERQKERLLMMKEQKRNEELCLLGELLKKYPTEESRKILPKNCSTCAFNMTNPPQHTYDECESWMLQTGKDNYMWSPNQEYLDSISEYRGGTDDV